MKITIYQNREVYKEESKIGNDSENKVETLEFEFPEEYEDFTKYIEFQIKGEKYVDLIEDNKYVITREVAKYGKIKTQVVLKKNTENDVMIFKSDVFTLNVSNSINATENLVHTVGIDLIEKIVTKNNEQDARLDTLEADNTTNKENILNLQNDNTTNKSDIKSLQDDNETNKTDISNIKQEQTTQNTNVSNLQTDNTSNKAKILDLEAKNTEQDTNIQKNTDDIAEINAKNTTQDEEIAQIKEKDTAQDSLIEQLQTKVVNLEAENTSLKNQIPSGEATGNPIHLTDSSNMECEIVPIGGAEQETREGYNLGKYNVGTKTVNGVTFTHNEDDSMTINGTPTGYIWFDMSDGVLLKAGTYTFAIEYYNLASGDDQVQVINKTLDKTIKSLYATNTVQSNKKVVEFTLEEDAVCMLRYYCRRDDTINNQKLYAMILNGSYTVDTLPPYEPYGAMPSPDYPSEIVTVGQNGSVEIKVDNGLETTDTNYQSYTKTLPIQQEMLEGDYIEDVEHHGWGKYEITGNEDWKKSGNPNNISYYLIINSILVNIDGNTFSPSSSESETKVAIVLSNHFKAISPNQLFKGSENGICLNWAGREKQMRLGFGLDSDINTVDKLKAWLKSLYDAGTPVIVYYKLATPKSLELTEDQKSVLNSFYTYKGITNISVDGIATLKVNYKKDLETIINKLSATSVAE